MGNDGIVIQLVIGIGKPLNYTVIVMKVTVLPQRSIGQ